MKLRCKKELANPFNKSDIRLIPGQYYKLLESDDLYCYFGVPVNIKGNSDVVGFRLDEVDDYFETLEETRDNTLNEILK